ncbi:3'-5' exonuclease [Leptospira bouyouniensis]|uniref:3'-5' exonuclease n=1 Tax=Leptospira bouyouniensis TaxID=2484911 RepID=A0A7I0HPV8_9LEPT|nr:3'-5' exonuclease [Leptospira bouyouniensis]TGL04052.1 3'-5' exonuclease [Leptospira bouyouniensis]
MIGLSIDIETSGLDILQSSIIEIGVVQWDFIGNKPLNMFSKLVRHGKNEQNFSSEIEKITGIANSDLNHFGYNLAEVLFEVKELIKYSDFLCGHNAILFDREILYRLFLNQINYRLECHWIDTMFDLETNDEFGSRKLRDLIKIFDIPSFLDHRAFFDALSVILLISKTGFEQCYKNSLSNLIRISIELEYENREQAKRKGFFWNKNLKCWEKIIRSHKKSGYMMSNLKEEIIYFP